MNIDGLDEKPKLTIEELGTFKLKDKAGRNAIQIDLSKATRPLNEARYLYIVKERGRNNCVKVSIHWKPSETISLKEAKKKTDKLFKKKKP